MFNISFKAINFPFISEHSGIIILESTGMAGRPCCSDTSSCDLCLILSPAQASRCTQGYFCWGEDHCICRIHLQADVESWKEVCKHGESFQQSWFAVPAPSCQDPAWFSINPAFPMVWQGTHCSRCGVQTSACEHCSTEIHPCSTTFWLTEQLQPFPSPAKCHPQTHPCLNHDLSSKTPGFPPLLLLSHKLQELKVLEMLRVCWSPTKSHQGVSKCFL